MWKVSSQREYVNSIGVKETDMDIIENTNWAFASSVPLKT